MVRALFVYTLLAAFAASSLADSKCRAPVDLSCPTGARAQQCSSQISRLSLKRTTCTIPSTTTTKTVTIKPTTTTTESITSYRTILITNRRSVATDTVTTTVPVVKEITVKETETIVTYAEVTDTSTVTVTAQRGLICTGPQIDPRLKHRRHNMALDSDCSCLLTVTKACGKTTTTKTTTLPTSTKTTKKTVSKVTTTYIFAGSTYTRTATVESVTATSTVTESLSTTSFTSTSTASAEVTQTLPFDYCQEDGINLINRAKLSTQGLTWDSDPSDSLSECCRQCNTAKNCAFYEMGEDGTCTKWFITPEAPRRSCPSEECQWGTFNGVISGGDSTYGQGICGSGQQQR